MQKKTWTKVTALCLGISAFVLSACSTTPPANPRDLCSIFQEKDSWYVAAHKVHKKYGVPINVAMSIMFHESGFVDDAKPPMRWFLFIPYGRGSSAYGYAQAQDAVWSEYLEEQGSYFSDRDDFDDALDFIGWYMTKSKKINNVPLTDAYRQYLNYHEGWGGYASGSYKGKDSLLRIAQSVKRMSDNYKQQLLKCNLY
ncbi:Uncharacterized protein conserved in bacteria [Anaerobiospirillum thomasii]|uniref:Uncharacterized protein conserved in bacteria n=1 Tax=Anaerobiospirillum thomasii TaxID=179995 RepID=A0A2X0VTS5_9GAMM|nr:hypothetical protein [Anaerobiospirillum thomasii]SPT68912.1 Uncharacterized protein conserved in bacteria [Anaerobiospirillum thomasii]SPT71140.1 Uncharacterized protein conserved in bacteria [Anaerobiospirillum thomasii]